MPVHVSAEVLANKRAGAYRVLTLAAAGVADGFRPGMFVALSVPDGHLARRPLWIHRVRETGAHGASIDVVVEPVGVGSRWIASLSPGARLPLTGPLGRPFALPREPVGCLLVGEGVWAAPLFTLAERLRERECPVTLMVAAADEAHLLSALEARRLARSVTVVTADGSVGVRGSAESQVATVLAASGAQVVYGAGTPRLLRVVAEAATAHGVSAQVALAPQMTCATGLCGGCEVPVEDEGGAPHWARACLEGPAMRGDRVRWDAWQPAGGGR